MGYKGLAGAASRGAFLFFAVFLMAIFVPMAMATPQVERTNKVGQGLFELVFNPADHLVYVASAGDWGGGNSGILGLDSQTLKVKRSIAVGKNIPFGIALNKKTQRLYATNTTTGTVSVYDVATGKELAVIKNGASTPHLREVAVDESTNTIYATAVGGVDSHDGKPVPKSELWVIDGHTNTIKTVISDPVQTVTGLAVDPIGRRLYVSDLAKNEVGVFDLTTLKALRRFPTGAGKVFRFGVPEADQKPESDTVNITLDAEGKRLFAINQASGTVTVLDPEDGTLLKTIATGAGALSAQFNAKTNELYVANRGDGTVTVVDGKTYAVTAHLPSGTHPQTVAIDRASGKVYVSNKAKGKDFKDKSAPEPYEPGGDTVTIINP